MALLKLSHGGSIGAVARENSFMRVDELGHVTRGVRGEGVRPPLATVSSFAKFEYRVSQTANSAK